MTTYRGGERNGSADPVGRLLGIPGVDGGDETVSGLKSDLAQARGKVALPRDGRLEQRGRRFQGGTLQTHRFGPEPPSGLVQLLSAASNEVYAGCGPERFSRLAVLVELGRRARRGAWRSSACSRPWGKLCRGGAEGQVGRTPFRSHGTELRASDLQGRARSVASLVGAGVPVQAAAKEAGPDDWKTEGPVVPAIDAQVEAARKG